MQKKRVFITGIAGFIGFHLAKTLAEQGHIVHGIDNLNAYYCRQLKFDRIHVLQQLSVEITQGDICDHSLLQKIFHCFEPTHIIHLAAQAGVRYSLENPNSYIHSNIVGLTQILEVIKAKPIPFIFASSSSVYGKNTKIPYEENDPCELPSSLYAATKKSGELIAYSYHHLYGIPMVGLRFFTVYGPWGRPDMAYFSFTEKILKQEPITLYNEGKLKRDFTYIDDIIVGITAALDYKCEYEIFNLGNHQSVEVKKLVTTLETLWNKQALIEYAKKPATDCEITFADIDKASNELGYYPKTAIEQGLSHFVDWYKHYKNL